MAHPPIEVLFANSLYKQFTVEKSTWFHAHLLLGASIKANCDKVQWKQTKGSALLDGQKKEMW